MQHPQRIEPGPNQESVWDYPRPPQVEACKRRVRVMFNGLVIAESTQALRVLETSHPPNIYIPPIDVLMELFEPMSQRTVCEYKGVARYWSVRVQGRCADLAAWSYPSPNRGYESLANYISFYPARVDACYLDDELVTPQEGGFYGGWITSDIVGPFKGGEGTMLW